MLSSPFPRRNREHLVVCGDDPLAFRVVEELVTRYGETVTVILPSKRRGHGPDIARLPAVRIVESERLDADAFHAARLPSARAVALLGDEDVTNIHAALRVQEVNPKLRLVLRMGNNALRRSVGDLFDNCTTLSDAMIAAPAFVAAGLDEVAPARIRLPGRTLYAIRRDRVDPERVVCGVADTSGEGPPRLLPADEGGADVVLAHVDDASPPAITALRRRRGHAAWKALGGRAVRTSLLGAVALVAVLLTCITIWGSQHHIGWFEAAYAVLLTAIGGGEPDTTFTPSQKTLQLVTTVAGLGLVPLLTAAVVAAIVNTRLALLHDQPAIPESGHVVVMGLGGVGTRVLRQLNDLRLPVVAVDIRNDARGLQIARQLGVPVVVGDAGLAETLDDARVDTCRALLALTTDDVTNLRAALQARALQPELRVVLRLFDGDLASRVRRGFGIRHSRSVSYLAAPAFAAAMVDRQVVCTIPVGRHVLLVADVPVCGGSELDGAEPAAAGASGQVRVLGVLRGDVAAYTPEPLGTLAAGDRLLVVATRAGLGAVVDRTTAAG